MGANGEFDRVLLPFGKLRDMWLVVGGHSSGFMITWGWIVLKGGGGVSLVLWDRYCCV